MTFTLSIRLATSRPVVLTLSGEPKRVRLNAASSAVTSMPLWNFTPLRTVNVYVLPSGEIFQSSAIPVAFEIDCPAGSTPTSWS